MKQDKDTWFKARYNWSEIFDDLNDGDLRLLILTIWRYAKDGTEPDELQPQLKLAWRLIKGELAQDEFYRECGKKGGSPQHKTPTPSRGVEGGLEEGAIDKKRREKKREEQEETRKDIITPAGNNKFRPPTLEEVKAYCEERGNGIDPEQFIDFYQARGWELKSGQKVKDWKACIRTWERNEKGSGIYGVSRTVRENHVPGQRDLYGL